MEKDNRLQVAFIMMDAFLYCLDCNEKEKVIISNPLDSFKEHNSYKPKIYSDITGLFLDT